MKYEFPKGFLWGASTSSHQVEGNANNDWTEWEKKNAERLAREAKQKFGSLPNWSDIETEATNPQNYVSGIACDHYNRFREDFDLAKQLGHNAHRLSIEWSRVEPEEGKFDKEAIEHYRQVLTALRERGIEPFVTLWHWTLPIWLSKKGGAASRDFPDLFARYAKRMARELPEVVFWITINEPEIYSSHSYMKGQWPPQNKNFFALIRVLKNLEAGHKTAFREIKKINEGAQIGIAANNIWFEATGLWSRLLKIFADRFWNSLFLNKISGYQDFIGLNNYFHNRISFWFNRNKDSAVSDMGWELRPEAIYHCLIGLKKYGKPVYVTENGLADAGDKKREWFTKESLKNAHRAISEGADVRGYLHWSLLDNFEWDKGFWPRFGLVEIDYKTLGRKPRPSAFAYKKIIEDNGIAE